MQKNVLKIIALVVSVFVLGLVIGKVAGGDRGFFDRSSHMGGMFDRGSDGKGDGRGKSDADPDDVMFSTMMIPHHEQAVEMSTLAETRSTNADVLKLAAQIKAAQAPEIELMKSWNKEWGVSDMGGMHDGHMMGGMLNGAQMVELENAKGAEFDKLFLTGMIAHHEGAIEMANDVIKYGSDERVIELAKSIVESQTAETELMKELLAKIG